MIQRAIKIPNPPKLKINGVVRPGETRTRSGYYPCADDPKGNTIYHAGYVATSGYVWYIDELRNQTKQEKI